MNSLITINNKNLSIKEFQNQRVVTFKDIDTVHERVEGTASRNFRENNDKFIKNTDYFLVTGDELKKLKQATNFVGSNANGIILITESGYLMLVKSLNDSLAWKVQRELVNNYFRKNQIINDLNSLSPQLQVLINMELRQRELESEIASTKQEIQGMRDVITINPNGWRKETSTIINKIALKAGGYEHIKLIRDEIYKVLNQRLGVDVQTRLTYKRRRMADEGVRKSKRDKLTIVDVIADDKKLIEGYVAIVKEMAIKSGVA